MVLLVQEVDLADLVLLAAGIGRCRRRHDGGQVRGAVRFGGVFGDEFLLGLTTAVAHGRRDRERNCGGVPCRVSQHRITSVGASILCGPTGFALEIEMLSSETFNPRAFQMYNSG